MVTYSTGIISWLFLLGSESHHQLWIELCTDLSFSPFTCIFLKVGEASGILCHDTHLSFRGIRSPILFPQINHILNWCEGYILTPIYFLHRDILWQVLSLKENVSQSQTKFFDFTSRNLLNLVLVFLEDFSMIHKHFLSFIKKIETQTIALSSS